MKNTLLRALNAGILLAALAIVNGCAQVDDLSLEQNSDNFGPFFTEYGHCKDGWDNDGNGLVDEQDPNCHFVGPLRDLSAAPTIESVVAGVFSPGHNFLPNTDLIPIGGPGEPGGFRDYAQIADWFGFLTDMNGITAGTVVGPAYGVDPKMSPTPAPLAYRNNRGTEAQGNNNNPYQPFYTQPFATEVSMFATSSYDNAIAVSEAPAMNEVDMVKHHSHIRKDKKYIRDEIGRVVLDNKYLIENELVVPVSERRAILPLPDVVYGSPWGGTPLYTNQDPNFPGTGSQGFIGGVNRPN